MEQGINEELMDAPRIGQRLGRAKDIISERKSEKIYKDMGVRKRSFYEDADFDAINAGQISSSNLQAPPMPGYVQRWVSMNKERGAHLLKLLTQVGWSIRDPKTVPHTAGLNTGKWGEYDAIIAGNELILCCIRKDVYEKYQRQKCQEQIQKTLDTAAFGRDLYGATRDIRSNHVSMYQPSIQRD